MVLKCNSYVPEKIEVIYTETKSPCMARWGVEEKISFILVEMPKKLKCKTSTQG